MIIFYINFDFSLKTIVPRLDNEINDIDIYQPLANPQFGMIICDPLDFNNNVAKRMIRLNEMIEVFRAILLGIGSGYGCSCDLKEKQSMLQSIFSAVIGVAIRHKETFD